MLTFYQLEKRINDISHEIVPQDINFTTLHSAKLDVLKWCRLEGEVRNKEEILNRIQRYNEELLACTEDNIMSRQIKVRIEELNNVINL